MKNLQLKIHLQDDTKTILNGKVEEFSEEKLKLSKQTIRDFMGAQSSMLFETFAHNFICIPFGQVKYVKIEITDDIAE